MEVLNPAKRMLTNYDVYSLLCDIRDGNNGEKKPLPSQMNLAKIVSRGIKYLENTPCTVQSVELHKGFNRELEEFKLTKAERLQILNLRATTDLEMQLIVEESEERLSEENVTKLCDIVANIIPEKEAS